MGGPENYNEFDKASIIADSDIVIKGFRLRKRDLFLGCLLLACFVVIIILAALLGAAKNNRSESSQIANGGTSEGQTSGQGQEKCDSLCLTPGCMKSAANSLELLSPAISPCEDFQTYACGMFKNVHPLQPDRPDMTTKYLVYYQNQDRLERLLEQPSSSDASTSYERKLKAFFNSCTEHFEKMRQQGRPFLEQVVTPSGGWWALEGNGWNSSAWNFQTALKKVHVDFWTDAFFTFSIAVDLLDWNKRVIEIDLSGLGLDYRYFLREEFKQDILDYKKFIRTVSSLLLRDAGLNLTEQEQSFRVDTFVQDAFTVEYQLAQIKANSNSTANAHASQNRVTLRTLDSRTHHVVDWVGLFKYMFSQANVNEDTYVVVQEQEYVIRFAEWIDGLPGLNKSRILNNYMIWRLAHRYVQDLSWDYMHANRELYFDLTGEKDFLGSWLYCFNKINDDMSEALGALFIKDHFLDENKRTVHEITDTVKNALMENLDDANHWMDPGTRIRAAQKLKESLIKLGYPEYMTDETKLNNIYANLVISDDYFANLLSFNKFFKDDWNTRLARQDSERRAEWVYPVYSFVAEYFNPWKELIVPAGLLQFPIYDYHNPGFMNYGSMGTIVARQLVHAVDEIGNQYLLNGSDHGQWWSPQTEASYAGVKKCIIDSYVNETQGPFRIPGRELTMSFPVDIDDYYPLALGEASGIKLALRAYKDWVAKNGTEKRMPGFQLTNEQMFFVAYAQTYCENREPSLNLGRAIRGTILENLKVNKALSQVEEFQKAFNCADGAKMVAKTRCKLY